MALLALIFLATVPDSLPRLSRLAVEPAVVACRRAGLHRGTFLAFLAYRSIFFLHESPGRGAYLSFLSQSAFFFRKALRTRECNEVIQ